MKAALCFVFLLFVLSVAVISESYAAPSFGVLRPFGDDSNESSDSSDEDRFGWNRNRGWRHHRRGWHHRDSSEEDWRTGHIGHRGGHHRGWGHHGHHHRGWGNRNGYQVRQYGHRTSWDDSSEEYGRQGSYGRRRSNHFGSRHGYDDFPQWQANRRTSNSNGRWGNHNSVDSQRWMLDK